MRSILWIRGTQSSSLSDCNNRRALIAGCVWTGQDGPSPVLNMPANGLVPVSLTGSPKTPQEVWLEFSLPTHTELAHFNLLKKIFFNLEGM